MTARTAAAAGLLVVEAGLAVLGVLGHYGLTAEYGDITDSALQAWTSGFTAGIGGVALVVLTLFAVVATAASTRPGMRLTAVLLPILMVLGMLAVTPAALRHKLAVQYSATPQCVLEEDLGAGPARRAAQQSQQAFESIDHVGHFGGGGGSGIGGCDRSFVLTEEVDVLGHYRAVLPAAGWRVVESRADRLRAERAGMAFEVTVCRRGGLVWAGARDDHHGASCGGGDESVTGPT